MNNFNIEINNSASLCHPSQWVIIRFERKAVRKSFSSIMFIPKKRRRRKSKKPCCSVCSQKLEGRSDKQFCNIKCKNKFHKIKRIDHRNQFKEYEVALRHNWTILNGLKGQASKKRFSVRKGVLIKEGFKFDYITKIDNTDKDKPIYWIHDYCLELLKNDRLLIYTNTDPQLSKDYTYRRYRSVAEEETTIYRSNFDQNGYNHSKN